MSDLTQTESPCIISDVQRVYHKTITLCNFRFWPVPCSSVSYCLNTCKEAILSSPEIFDVLVIGLSEFLRADGKYPYPDMLSRACNVLALHMTTPAYPRTWSGLLTLLEKPVCTWYPLAVPEPFDAEMGLTYDGNLSEEASRYLHQELYDRAEIRDSMSSRSKGMALHNRQFQTLLDRLRDSTDSRRAQQEYVLLRSFLIEHPYTTGEEISRMFAMRSVGPNDVGKLYEDCHSHEAHWHCTSCGPLIERQGRLRGVRPSLCDDHRRELSTVRAVEFERDMRRVQPGIHWRVTLPGIPEMSLFLAMEALQQKHPEHLLEVLRWPGIDRYDLRLLFSDEKAWAVDVKDREDPYRLAADLKPLYNEADLKYDEAFYLFPARRLRENQNYRTILQEESSPLPSTHMITSISDFEARVTDKIQWLKRASRVR